jgi:hypothetical protein
LKKFFFEDSDMKNEHTTDLKGARCRHIHEGKSYGSHEENIYGKLKKKE